ncbi:MAG TPA: glycosyltransferase family 1 protein [Longimicrobiales bacterium]
MRIGIDACCWANNRGYGRFTRELLRALVAQAPEDEFVCFVDPALAARFDLKGANVRVVVVPQRTAPTDAATSDGHRSVGDMVRFTRAVAREPLDVFFSPSVYTYFPLPPGLPALVTVHDAIAERFPKLTLPTPQARLFWRLKVRLAIWQSRLVLTVSDYSALELQRVLKVPRNRLRVSLEAPAAAYRPSNPADIGGAAARVGLPAGARWFVYVGGFNPHKRVDQLVRAHGEIARQMKDPPHLVLVGAPDRDGFHKDVDSIRREIEQAGTGHLVHWPGFLADEELRHIHSGALALVLPSESEGFGLPAVEAAACGTAVVATTESPLPQLLAGGGEFVQPGDVAGLAAALQRIAMDEPRRTVMAANARERASRLDWARSANATLNALREAAGRRPRPLTPIAAPMAEHAGAVG